MVGKPNCFEPISADICNVRQYINLIYITKRWTDMVWGLALFDFNLQNRFRFNLNIQILYKSLNFPNPFTLIPKSLCYTNPATTEKRETSLKQKKCIGNINTVTPQMLHLLVSHTIVVSFKELERNRGRRWSRWAHNSTFNVSLIHPTLSSKLIMLYE